MTDPCRRQERCWPSPRTHSCVVATVDVGHFQTRPMECPECGYGYVESLPGNRRLHRQYHAGVMDGPRSAALAKCRHLRCSGSRSVVVINNKSRKLERRLAEKVSLVAAGDVDDFTGLSYAANEAPDSRRIHLFIGVESDRARAYLCVEWRSCVWHCTWEEYEAGMARPQVGLSMWSVGFAWVARAHRRKGWTRTVLAAAARHLQFDDEFGWYTPFTPDGEAFARAVCPVDFYIAK